MCRSIGLTDVITSRLPGLSPGGSGLAWNLLTREPELACPVGSPAPLGLPGPQGPRAAMGRSLRASFALDSAQVPKRRPLRRRWRRTLRNRGALFGYFFPRPPSGDSLACSHVWLGLRVVPSRHRGALRPPTPGRASVPATMTSVASKPRRRDEEAAPRGGDFPPRTCAAVPRVRVHPLFRGENFANRRFVWRLPEHSPATFFSLAGAHVLVPRLPKTQTRPFQRQQPRTSKSLFFWQVKK